MKVRKLNQLVERNQFITFDTWIDLIKSFMRFASEMPVFTQLPACCCNFAFGKHFFSAAFSSYVDNANEEYWLPSVLENVWRSHELFWSIFRLTKFSHAHCSNLDRVIQPQIFLLISYIIQFFTLKQFLAILTFTCCSTHITSLHRHTLISLRVHCEAFAWTCISVVSLFSDHFEFFEDIYCRIWLK